MTTTEQREASRQEERDPHGRRYHSSSRSRRDDRSPRRRRDDRRHESDRAHYKSRDEESARAADRDQKRNKDVAQADEPLNAEAKSLSHAKDDPSAKHDRPPRGTKRFSESRESRRPQSSFQHDERGSAGQGGRRYDRQNSDYGRQRGQKEHLIDRHKEKANGDSLQIKVEQAQQEKDGDSTWKHDGFFQLEEEAPLAKRRPPIQEMKMSLEQESAPSVTELDSGSQNPDQPGTTAALREERRNYYSRGFGNRRSFVRPDDRGFRRGFPDNRSDGHRLGYDSRGRFPGRGGMDRDRFHNPNGWRGNAYNAAGDQGEKWKHDLYDQTNRSPTPKTEEEQIARVEALLSL
ncbi:hypothetical protein EJB05_07647 [Eragrostis curvula]|uniref:Btz domain-containing protein n=1 Tax=Eragrostis curvula TaxID=38414 RepID=A0A5J9WJC1_9POAL|nr:hypothetical protein EJB05_07647 [Eragrostis curvula]